MSAPRIILFRKRVMDLSILAPLPSVTPSSAVLSTNFALTELEPDVDPNRMLARLRFLAGDHLKGRGSGTRDEWIAAAYIASLYEEAGLEPGGDVLPDGSRSYIQTITRSAERPFIDGPTLSSVHTTTPGPAVDLMYGKDMVALNIAGDHAQGPLRFVDIMEDGSVASVQPGDVVVLSDRFNLYSPAYSSVLEGLSEKGAAAILIPSSQDSGEWNLVKIAYGDVPAVRYGLDAVTFGYDKDLTTVVLIDGPDMEALRALGEGHTVKLGGQLQANIDYNRTWNVHGILPGTDPEAGKVLLSSHLDHLGERKQDDMPSWYQLPEPDENGEIDLVYNGTNDDASGTVAMLEMMSILAEDGPEKRTVVFSAFGSEEEGLVGSRYFARNPTLPLDDLVANIQFEMLARIPEDYEGPLTFTGFERSSLGPELNKHGANLDKSPRPWESLFTRSDNYSIAKQLGVPAHTVIYDDPDGDDEHYHQPSDEIENANLQGLYDATESLVEPIEWLLNSDFKPVWNPSQNPYRPD